MTQQILVFGAVATSPQAKLLLYALQGANRWMTARELVGAIGGDERTVRACAEELGCEVISGQRGYRHVDLATPEEIRHFIRWMESQAKRMTQRALRTQRRAHKLIGAA